MAKCSAMSAWASRPVGTVSACPRFDADSPRQLHPFRGREIKRLAQEADFNLSQLGQIKIRIVYALPDTEEINRFLRSHPSANDLADIALAALREVGHREIIGPTGLLADANFEALDVDFLLL